MTKSWTPEMVDYLRTISRRKHLTTADAALEISAKFSVEVTRNAIIGISHRKKIRIGVHGGVRAPRKPPQPKPRPQLAVSVAPQEPPEPPHRLTIYELRRGVCHYPVVGDAPPFLYCGEPAADSGSYCAEHRERCYTRARGAHENQRQRAQHPGVDPQVPGAAGAA